MAKSLFLILLIVFMALCGKVMAVATVGYWDDAHATFYGDMHGGETMRKCRSTLFYFCLGSIHFYEKHFRKNNLFFFFFSCVCSYNKENKRVFYLVNTICGESCFLHYHNTIIYLFLIIKYINDMKIFYYI